LIYPREIEIHSQKYLTQIESKLIKNFVSESVSYFGIFEVLGYFNRIYYMIIPIQKSEILKPETFDPSNTQFV
jgi:hypothetical protein